MVRALAADGYRGRLRCCYHHWVAIAPLAQLAEQRTLNPRVRGSSPWRRTRTDLGFLPFPWRWSPVPVAVRVAVVAARTGMPAALCSSWSDIDDVSHRGPAPGRAAEVRCAFYSTLRNTEKIFPMMIASSPGMGRYAWLCGMSQTWLADRVRVLTVASSSILAATMSPFSASG